MSGPTFEPPPTAGVPTVVNVKDLSYGAVGDGTTNDTAAVNAAINAASAAAVARGPGAQAIVYFPSATYLGNFTLKPQVILDLGGSVLKAPGSSNADVIQGVNFGTLTGKTKATGDYALGCYDAGVRNGIVDGNKANNTSGYGIRIWGRHPTLENVLVRNCASGGIWTEFTDVDSFADPTQVLEGWFEDVRVTGCAVDGWTHRGPHDSVGVNLILWDNSGWGFTTDAVASGYTGGAFLYDLNCFSNTSGQVRALNQAGITCYGGQAAGSNSGTGVLLQNGGDLIGMTVAGNATGVDLTGQNCLVDIKATNNPGDAIKLTSVGWSTIKISGANNTNVLNVVSESGPNLITGAVNVGVGQTFSTGATLGSHTTAIVSASGAGGQFSVVRIPTNSIAAQNGFTPNLPASNGTLMPSGVSSLTYGATVATDASTGVLFKVTVTNTTAFTIQNPTNPTQWRITYDIVNSSGGVMGAITWGTQFKLAGAFTNPANGKRRTITFYWDGTNWVETDRAAADI